MGGEGKCWLGGAKAARSICEKLGENIQGFIDVCEIKDATVDFEEAIPEVVVNNKTDTAFYRGKDGQKGVFPSPPLFFRILLEWKLVLSLS